MSTLQTFMVSSHDNNLQVVLEVDTDKLTAERASQVNDFFGNSEHRLYSEDGDVVKAVIRFFGASAISNALCSGGAAFDERLSSLPSKSFTSELHDEEGFGGGDGTPHGWIGIRVVSIECEPPGFDGVELSPGRVAT